MNTLIYFYLIYMLYNAFNVMWFLGYSVAVGEFNGDDDEGKECNLSADFLMWPFIAKGMWFVFRHISPPVKVGGALWRLLGDD